MVPKTQWMWQGSSDNFFQKILLVYSPHGHLSLDPLLNGAKKEVSLSHPDELFLLVVSDRNQNQPSLSRPGNLSVHLLERLECWETEIWSIFLLVNFLSQALLFMRSEREVLAFLVSWIRVSRSRSWKWFIRKYSWENLTREWKLGSGKGKKLSKGKGAKWSKTPQRRYSCLNPSEGL